MNNPHLKAIISCLLISAMLLTFTACSTTAPESNETTTAPADTPVSVVGNDYGAAIENAEVGKTFIFGKYEQDNNEDNGDEPIEWRVLDKNEKGILLISEYILDYTKFDYAQGFTNWDVCSIRNSWNNFSF